jgi:alpha-L-rhamnosidase
LNQIVDDQQTDGEVSNFVPNLGSGAGAPNWQSAFPTVLWSQWKYAGDVALVERHWVSIKKYAAYWAGEINKKTPMEFPHGFGDWVQAGPTKSEEHMTGLFAAIHDLGLIGEMAEALKDSATETLCKDAVASGGTQFHTQWYNATKKCYNQCLQTENAFGLWLGVSTDSKIIEGVVEQTINDVMTTHSGHTTSGILGIKAIYEAMSTLGRSDLPVLMNQVTTYPSYGYMITNKYEPATTMWELWNSDTQGPGMNSRNHIMFGSVSSWFYRHLCGLDAADRGYDIITIYPKGFAVKGSQNNAAKCTILTPRGRATSSWRSPAVDVNGQHITTSTSNVELNATVPMGAKGMVRVPLVAAVGHKLATVTITESGKIVWKDGSYVPGVDGFIAGKIDHGPSTSIEGEGVVFTVRSGNYLFVVQ